MKDDKIAGIAERVAGGKSLPTWSVVQHDGKGEVIAVTPNVSAPSAAEAIAVVKDMARRGGGPLGKAVAFRTEDTARIAEGW